MDLAAGLSRMTTIDYAREVILRKAESDIRGSEPPHQPETTAVELL